MQIPLTFMTMLDSRLAYSLLLSCRQTITITQYIPTILLLGYFHFVIILSPLLRLLVSLLRLLVSISHVAAIINTMIYEITSKENYHSVLSFTQNRLDTRRLPCPRIQDKISLLVTIGLTCRYPASHDYSPPLSVAAYSHSHPPPPTSALILPPPPHKFHPLCFTTHIFLMNTQLNPLGLILRVLKTTCQPCAVLGKLFNLHLPPPR